MSITQRKIEVDMYRSELQADLSRYLETALGLGASRAAVVPVTDIPLDDRVVLKCRIPRCSGYGISANCPPNTVAPAEMREILANYEWSVFFSLDVDPAVIVRDRATVVERLTAQQQVFDVVADLESKAFYDGHYMAFGLGAGSCRHTYCSQTNDCMAVKGERCRHPLKARPSMEAVGIDVFRMMAQLGWEVYPTGSAIKAAEAQCGKFCGIVVVQ